VSDLDVIPGGVLRIDAHPIPPNATEPGHTHVDLAIGFTAGSWAIGPVAEVLDARWVAFDDLGSYGVDEAVLAGVASLSRRLGSIG
jgi:hypothetical protein